MRYKETVTVFVVQFPVPPLLPRRSRGPSCTRYRAPMDVFLKEYHEVVRRYHDHTKGESHHSGPLDPPAPRPPDEEPGRPRPSSDPSGPRRMTVGSSGSHKGPFRHLSVPSDSWSGPVVPHPRRTGTRPATGRHRET